MKTLLQISKTPLSLTQIKAFLPGIPVILYADFKGYTTLPPVVVYLFLTNENFGHFCCVIRRGIHVELFDSYGISPESEHSFVSSELLDHLGERRSFLTKMCAEKGWILSHNSTKLQAWGKMETCGRHVVERVRKRAWGLGEYVSWLLGIAKTAETSADMVVSFLVE